MQLFEKFLIIEGIFPTSNDSESFYCLKTIYTFNNFQWVEKYFTITKWVSYVITYLRNKERKRESEEWNKNVKRC